LFIHALKLTSFSFLFAEKLHTSEGRELRRALFSLKQIFQEDKDLVHGFVALGGLNCLVQIGSEADQNYQNYILRALGQVKFISTQLFCH
jgi:FH1/FH2 domain-containing protein 3